MQIMITICVRRRKQPKKVQEGGVCLSDYNGLLAAVRSGLRVGGDINNSINNGWQLP